MERESLAFCHSSVPRGSCFVLPLPRTVAVEECVTSGSFWVLLGSEVIQPPEQHAALLGEAAGWRGALLCECHSSLERCMHAGEALASRALGVAHLSPVVPQRKGTRDLVPCGEKFGKGVWLPETCLQRHVGQPKAWPSSQATWCWAWVSWGNNVSHSQQGPGQASTGRSCHFTA